MWANPQIIVDLFTFTKDFFRGKLVCCTVEVRKCDWLKCSPSLEQKREENRQGESEKWEQLRDNVTFTTAYKMLAAVLVVVILNIGKFFHHAASQVS